MRLRAATEQDIRQWFDGKVPASMRALVAEHEGEVLGIAGIALRDDHAEAFSAYKPAMRQWPVTMAKAAVVFCHMLDRAGVPVFALCSDTEKTAPRLLERLGFKHKEGQVWRYG